MAGSSKNSRKVSSTRKRSAATSRNTSSRGAASKKATPARRRRGVDYSTGVSAPQKTMCFVSLQDGVPFNLTVFYRDPSDGSQVSWTKTVTTHSMFWAESVPGTKIYTYEIDYVKIDIVGSSKSYTIAYGDFASIPSPGTSAYFPSLSGTYAALWSQTDTDFIVVVAQNQGITGELAGTLYKK